MKHLITVSLLLTFFTANVFAGGFQLNEHGAKAKAMGGAFTAVANDPSAIYWNGAGLTQLTGTHIMLGTHLIAPSTLFRGVSPNVDKYYMEPQIFFPTHFFASHSFSNDLAIGLGFTTPFGLGTKWPEEWVGKYLAIETELRTFTISPVVAYEIIDNLSISAAFVYSFADVTLTRKNSQAPFTGDAFVTLKGDDKFAYGYNFGLLFKPIEGLSVGAAFHSQLKYEFEGDVVTTGAKQLLDAKKLPLGKATAKLEAPMYIAGGIAIDLTSRLKLSAEFQRIFWSSYDTLAVDFEDAAYTDLKSPRDYKDSYIIRLGGEYKFDDFSLLGGVYFDKMPVDPEKLSPTLPDSDRLGFSLGISADILDNLNITGSYLFIRAKELTVTNSVEPYTPGGSGFNGTYNSYAHVLSLSLTYSL
ncbi:MAG: outer membrane protein transport protein [Ignavibacteriaceae bacterium]|nr:outer membrane protein transport protein [Ignavibacteriaceae bacterium]